MDLDGSADDALGQLVEGRRAVHAPSDCNPRAARSGAPMAAQNGAAPI